MYEYKYSVSITILGCMRLCAIGWQRLVNIIKGLGLPLLMGKEINLSTWRALGIHDFSVLDHKREITYMFYFPTLRFNIELTFSNTHLDFGEGGN